MAVEGLTLVANPGSASRKYAVFRNGRQIAALHFEHQGNSRAACILTTATSHRHVALSDDVVRDPVPHLLSILRDNHIIDDHVHIARIGLRVVAPTGLFLQDNVMDDRTTSELQAICDRAPLHIKATLQELVTLREVFTSVPIAGISDSQFHATKPDYAWNYGLPLEDSDRLELKRYGYHGISVAAVVETLRKMQKLPLKLIVCHLGGGASVTAVQDGTSIDTTMGYSPLEGVVMATRAGSLDIAAVSVLKQELNYNDEQVEAYLNQKSGLLGLSGSSADIRALLERESAGDRRASLALNTYVYNIQKAIGQMTAACNGCDMLIFTGTVGERAASMRQRILQPFHYLDLEVDIAANSDCLHPVKPVRISRLAHSRPIFVLPTDEAAEIARRTEVLLQH